MRRPVTTLAMGSHMPDQLFDERLGARLAATAEVDFGVVLTDFADLGDSLAETEVLFTCWGVKRIDAVVLDAAPKLRAVVHSAGSVKGFITSECWDRGIVVSSGAAANAVPVAEYTLAMILLSGKRVFAMRHRYAELKARTGTRDVGTIGNYRRTVGIVGASRVGRRVIELLRLFDLDVVVADPYLSVDEAAALGVRLVELDDLLRGCDIVSLHAPSLESTRHLIDRRRLALMADGTTLINSARGAIVEQDALVDELQSGRINAVIDTTVPEPLPADHPFFTLPNVILTPHVAGTIGLEVHRLAEWAIEEVERYAAGEPFAHAVTREQWDRIA